MRSRLLTAFAVLLVVSVPMLTPAPVAEAAPLTLRRLSGPDRYATAAAVSASEFAPGVPVAYVATGADFPDGLAAAPAAVRGGGPVLLTDTGTLPRATAAELQRLAPRRIVAVGGPAAVSDAVLGALDAYDAGGGVSRVSGADRYETAAAISRSTVPAGVGTVYVATGAAFPDALSGGAAAAARRGALLLVRPTSIPPATATELRRLAPQHIVVLGGPAAVSDGVLNALGAYASVRASRLSGADRYATAVAVAKATWPSGATGVFVASGERFPDALVSSALAGRRDAPLLLTEQARLPWVTWQEFKRQGPSTGTVVGGTSVVPDARMASLRRDCHVSVKVPAGSQQVFTTIPNAPGQVALTFDMGGRLDPAMDILRYLAANDVCATIFPTGAMSRTAQGQQILAFVRANPDLFEIGNHTMHHCDLVKGGGGSPTAAPCAGVTPTAGFIRSELGQAASVLRAGAGQDPAPYWRPPYGSYNAGVLAAAASAGYTKTFMWSIDTVDWKPIADGGPGPAQISDKVVNGATSGSIVLMHLGGYHTYEALRTMVPGLRARGLTPTSLSHMLH